MHELEGVVLTMDEYEAVRLSDLKGLTQEEAAEEMKVHRSTVSRILNSAHLKIADALVNVKVIRIEGGSCRILKRGQK